MVMSTLCYLLRDDEVLMLHRNKRDSDFHKGKWNGVGGKFEAGEDPYDCAIREIYEETGYRAINPEFAGFISFPGFYGEEDCHMFIFLVRQFSGEMKECNEGDLHWIKQEKMTELNLWDGDRYFIDWIFEQQKVFMAKFYYQEGHYQKHDVHFFN